MTAELVVDASVVVKWYIPERNHEQARALRDDYLDGQHDLVAPALLPFEVVNALKYSGEYDGRDLDDASDTLPEYGIELVRYRDIPAVSSVADEYAITIYDASYVALADDLDAVVYTADGTFLDEFAGSDLLDSASHIRSYS